MNLLNITIPAWMKEAACKDEPGDLFFPHTGQNPTYAREICAACPTTVQCLDYALTYEDGLARQSRHGVYGGLTPDERSRLNRRTA